jgi:hypothetical protein
MRRKKMKGLQIVTIGRGKKKKARKKHPAAARRV